MFMPLGLGAVAALTEHKREYVAWSWAINGFATVIGSVLSTILAMTFGFEVVLGLALAIYIVALVSLPGLLPAGGGDPAKAKTAVNDSALTRVPA
jgi:MFS family permease